MDEDGCGPLAWGPTRLKRRVSDPSQSCSQRAVWARGGAALSLQPQPEACSALLPLCSQPSTHKPCCLTLLWGWGSGRVAWWLKPHLRREHEGAWILVWAPDSSFLLTHTLGGSRRRLKCLSPCPPCGRPGWGSRLLPLVWPSPCCGRHLRHEPADGRFICICLSVCLLFKLNKQILRDWI